MRAEQLDLLASCGTPTLHPDGDRAVVSVLAPDLSADDYVGGLWVVPLDRSTPPRRLTRGHRDTEPRFSPDGKWLAFLRAEAKGKPQIHVAPAAGGDAVALTEAPLGAGSPRWSPDSARIAWCARVPEPGRYGTDEDVPADAEPPRLITRFAYRIDQVGYTNDRRHHVFVLDLPDLDALEVPGRAAGDSPGDADSDDANDADSGHSVHDGGSRGAEPNPDLPEARRLTDGDTDDTDVAWSADGARLYFVSAREADGQPLAAENLTDGVFSVAADGSDLRQIAGGSRTYGGPIAGSDGAEIFVLAGELGDSGKDFVGRNMSLFAVPVDGGEPRRLTDDETIDLGEVGSHLSVSTRGVLVQDRAHGSLRLLEIDPSAAEVDATSATEVAGGAAWHKSHAVSADGDTIVAVLADGTTPGELVVICGRGEPGPLTDVSARLRSDGGVRPTVARRATGSDGYPVQGWTVLPDPDLHGPGPYPLLLNIHGGPYAAYGCAFFDEAQVYAGAGYAVAMCNPRGAAGYGQAHGRAIRGAMGGVDTDDILAFLDDCLADPALSLDADRVGVMGGSYGGYMTAWLTTRTQRFRAAIVERGYLDGATMVGSSDIGWFFGPEYHGTPTTQADLEALRAQTPMAFVDRVRTPTLVIHSEADWRCPIEQGQRWWTELRLRGVEAELLIFPGEGHELSRSGRPKHRLARFEHILRWWDRQLGGSAGDRTRESLAASA